MFATALALLFAIAASRECGMTYHFYVIPAYCEGLCHGRGLLGNYISEELMQRAIEELWKQEKLLASDLCRAWRYHQGTHRTDQIPDRSEVKNCLMQGLPQAWTTYQRYINVMSDLQCQQTSGVTCGCLPGDQTMRYTRQSLLDELMLKGCLKKCGDRDLTAVNSFELAGGCTGVEVTPDGHCVKTKDDHNGEYHHDSDCTINVKADAKLEVTEWHVENHRTCGWDYLKIGDTKFCTKSPSGTIVEAGSSMVWHSDYSVAHDGFTICAADVTQCPSTHPFAYRPNRNFDYCCESAGDCRGNRFINADARDGRSDCCEGHKYTKCPNPPCADNAEAAERFRENREDAEREREREIQRERERQQAVHAAVQAVHFPNPFGRRMQVEAETGIKTHFEAPDTPKLVTRRLEGLEAANDEEEKEMSS